MKAMDRKRMRPTLRTVAGLLLTAAGVQAAATVPAPADAAGAIEDWAEDWSQWAFSQSLTLDTSPTGADVDGTVTGFPVLVRLVAPEFNFAGSQVRGRDLRFLGAADEVMPHHIEHWDSAGGSAAVWVRVGTLKGNTANQTLRMLWGNPLAPETGSGAKVFPAAQGHVSVWHLGNSGKSVRVNAAGGNLAVPVNYEGDESKPGLIGRCDSLGGGGNGDHLDLGDGYEDFRGGFSYSVWAYPTAAGFYARFLDLGNGADRDNIILARSDVTDRLHFDFHAPQIRSSVVDNALDLNQWQHLAVTFSKGVARLYRNGKPIKNDSNLGEIPKVRRTLNYIGRSNWSADAYYRGKLDEVRLAAVAHDDAWIKLSYENQKAAQSLVRTGDVRVRVREAIPEPHFTLPDSLDWSGSAPLTLRPLIPGLPGIKASRDSVLRYAWSVTPAGFPVDTVWQASSLLLRGSSAKGPFTVELCLDNAWTPQCRKTAVRIATPLSPPKPAIHAAAMAATGNVEVNTGVDAAGRRGRTGGLGNVRRFARP